MQLVPWTTEIARQMETLFAGDRPIPIRLWAILDGIIPGRIVVDESTQPTFAVLQELAEGTTYLGGVLTSRAATDAFALLRPYQEVVIGVWPGDPLRAALPAAPYYEGTAIDFTDRSPAIDLKRLVAVPAGYRLRRLDEELAPALAGYDYYVAMFGSVERALQNTIGYCLMHEETVVCEAVAGPLTRGLAEIGVGTAEAQRRKGLATVASACVILECEALGYRAFWNASQQNAASIALAQRLGFQTERSFTVLAWSTVTARQ
jgi:hypothetical protein